MSTLDGGKRPSSTLLTIKSAMDCAGHWRRPTSASLGSNERQIHALSSACLALFRSAIAARNSAQPGAPPTSSGGQAFCPSKQMGVRDAQSKPLGDVEKAVQLYKWPGSHPGPSGKAGHCGTGPPDAAVHCRLALRAMCASARTKPQDLEMIYTALQRSPVLSG